MIVSSERERLNPPLQEVVGLLQDILSNFSGAISPLAFISMAAMLLAGMFIMFGVIVPQKSLVPFAVHVNHLIVYIIVITALSSSTALSDQVSGNPHKLVTSRGSYGAFNLMESLTN